MSIFVTSATARRLAAVRKWTTAWMPAASRMPATALTSLAAKAPSETRAPAASKKATNGGYNCNSKNIRNKNVAIALLTPARKGSTSNSRFNSTSKDASCNTSVHQIQTQISETTVSLPVFSKNREISKFLKKKNIAARILTLLYL